jgi:hypothetical protein
VPLLSGDVVERGAVDCAVGAEDVLDVVVGAAEVVGVGRVVLGGALLLDAVRVCVGVERVVGAAVVDGADEVREAAFVDGRAVGVRLGAGPPPPPAPPPLPSLFCSATGTARVDLRPPVAEPDPLGPPAVDEVVDCPGEPCCGTVPCELGRKRNQPAAAMITRNAAAVTSKPVR